MLNVDFYNGSFDPIEAIEYINNSEKECVYTCGYEWKNPTTHRVPVTKEWVESFFKKESWIKITEEDEIFHIQSFSSNDMW